MNGNRTVTRNLAINRHVIGCQWIKVHIHEHNAPVRHIVASNAQVIPDNTVRHVQSSCIGQIIANRVVSAAVAGQFKSRAPVDTKVGIKGQAV